MSDASIIKEFLVALGFKISDAQFKKFEQGIAGAIKLVEKLATEVVVAEEAIAAAVVSMSARFEDLYYASQRIRSTVENIRGVGYAVSQMGGDAKGGLAALEDLASFMRSNPGGERFLGSLGVQTRDTKGELRDTSDIMRDLGARFAQMPYYIAKVRAGLLGIDEHTLQALIRGTDDWAAHYHEMAQRVGVDQQAAAQSTHDFMTQVRDLGAYLQLLGDKYLLPLLKPAERLIDLLKDLDRSSGGLSTTLIVLLAALAPIFALFGEAGLIAVGVAALANAILLLWDDFSTWKEGGKSLIDWDLWKPEIDAAQDAIGTLIGAFHDLASAFGETDNSAFKFAHSPGMRVLLDTLNLIADLTGTAAHNFRAIASLFTGNLKGFKEESDKALGYEADLFKPGPGEVDGIRRPGENSPYAIARKGASAAAAIAGPAAKALAAQREKFAIDYLKSRGVSDQVARGIVAGSIAESQFDPGAVNPKSGAFGIGQWTKSRRDVLSAQYSRNPTFDQQLQFLVQELQGGDPGGRFVLASRNAPEALLNYITRFMRPKDGRETAGDLQRGMQALAALGVNASPSAAPLANPGAVAAASGPWAASAAGRQVSMTQKTDIHVYATDPRQAADETLAGQGRVNGTLLRNMQTVLQ